MDNFYYIETKRNAHDITEKRGVIAFPCGASAADVLYKINELSRSAEYGWFCVRYFNGWLHDLIAEWWRGDDKPFYYYTYPAYQMFSESLGFQPHKAS